MMSKFEIKIEIGKYTMSNKTIEELEIYDITFPGQSGRYGGVSVGRDEDGYFVMTHRARSKSYPAVGDIPESVIRWVESTG